MDQLRHPCRLAQVAKELKDSEAETDQRERSAHDGHQRAIRAHARALERETGATRGKLGGYLPAILLREIRLHYRVCSGFRTHRSSSTPGAQDRQRALIPPGSDLGRLLFQTREERFVNLAVRVFDEEIAGDRIRPDR